MTPTRYGGCTCTCHLSVLTIMHGFPCCSPEDEPQPRFKEIRLAVVVAAEDQADASKRLCDLAETIGPYQHGVADHEP